MLLLTETGSQTIHIPTDKFRMDWTNTDTPPTNLIIGVFTNDMTRETKCVRFIKQTSTGAPLTVYEGNKMRLHFFTTNTGHHSGANGRIYLQPRGYWSYRIYEHSMNDTMYNLSASDLLSTAFLSTGLGALFIQVDKGKALVVTHAEKLLIDAGTLTHGVREYSNAVNEGSYTKHTDKVATSDIDTDNNFIHIK